MPAQAGVVAEGLAANGTHVRSSPSVGDVVVLNRKTFGIKLVHFKDDEGLHRKLELRN